MIFRRNRSLHVIGSLGAVAALALAAGACASPTEAAEATESAQAASAIDTNSLLASFKPGEERRLWRKSVPAKKEGDWDLVPSNAYWAARLAALSYEDMAKLPDALKAIGLDPQAQGNTFMSFEVPDTSTEAFYVASKDVAFLVFRGSQQKRDWQINLAMRERRGLVPGGRVHTGFSTAFESVWNGEKGIRAFLAARHQLDGHKTVQTTNGPPLYVIGHSLGGALALLATYSSVYDECIQRGNWGTLDAVDHGNDRCILAYIPVAATYTFGQPRVGSKTFAGDMAVRLSGINSPYYRFIDTNDVVPDGPKDLPFFPYGHVGRFDLNRGSTEGELSFVSYLDYDGNYFAKAQPGRGRFHLDGCLEPVTDHDISRYANKILAVGNNKPYVRPSCDASTRWDCDKGSGICACRTRGASEPKACCDSALTSNHCQVDATRNPDCASVCRE